MLPACVAAIVQLPAANPETVAADTEQYAGVSLLKITALPDAPPVAATSPVPPATMVGEVPKVIVWPSTPDPCNEITVRLPTALLVRVIEPTLAPVVAGLKVTAMLQVAPVATPEPQSFDCEKSPLAVILVKLNGAIPELVSVTFWAALLVPVDWLPKVRLLGWIDTCG